MSQAPTLADTRRPVTAFSSIDCWLVGCVGSDVVRRPFSYANDRRRRCQFCCNARQLPKFGFVVFRWHMYVCMYVYTSYSLWDELETGTHFTWMSLSRTMSSCHTYIWVIITIVCSPTRSEDRYENRGVFLTQQYENFRNENNPARSR